MSVFPLRIISSPSHHIRPLLQTGIVIDIHFSLELHGRLYSALLLLHHVPGLVRQVLFLARCYVYLSALGMGMGMGLELGGFG